MIDALARIHARFAKGLREVCAQDASSLRIGAELKFPLVTPDGSAAPLEKTLSLWQYLGNQGWELVHDASAGRAVGAKHPGEENDSVASCETGYCKIEFSLSHVGNLFEIQDQIDKLRVLLTPFAEREGVHFLAYGIQPVSRPRRALLEKKGRTSVWDKVFPSNKIVAPEDGDDVHLFTVNAASHVHINVPDRDAIRVVNVLNGFAGPQIALTADSSVWKGAVDGRYQAVAEKFWDWWEASKDRAGIPRRPFRDARDYIETVARFKPVYVKRDGRPVLLRNYETFLDYFSGDECAAQDLDGRDVALHPSPDDLTIHNSFYWYNARISRHYTVENRVYDQQPSDALACPAALTLGLASAAEEAWEELAAHPWKTLREARETACRHGLSGKDNGTPLRELTVRMLNLANLGLKRRGKDEEELLEPLYRRLEARRCPARDAADAVARNGVAFLVQERSFTRP